MSKKKISIWYNEKNLKNIKYNYILREKVLIFLKTYTKYYRYFSLRKNSAVDKKIMFSFVQENISGKISKNP